ncbi:hypothetical protein VZT92_001301 [Zoarces viviparus]|uniref:Uncharacterized protein n=1 Tax=Zoarces viviparus TaxID=48416 RepID=A0AAW1G444_ZOAVI
MCRRDGLDQLTGCVAKHNATALGYEDSVFLSAFAYFASRRVVKKSGEMSVTALRRQRLLWRKQAGQATADVYFKVDESRCPGGLVRRRSAD